MAYRFVACIGFAGGVLIPCATVEATFHFMQIEQVIGGVNGDVTAQAIQLRMRLASQNLLAASRLRAWDAAGANPVLIIDFTQVVPNAQSGDRVLIATAGFSPATSPGAVPDFQMTNSVPHSYLAAGSLTFEDDSGTIYWRLSWGGSGYTGSTMGDTTNDNDSGFGPADFGPPFAGPLPTTTLQALRFTGLANALSTTNAADYSLTMGPATFTNNARADFIVVAPVPMDGDINGDGIVNSLDLARFEACLNGADGSTPPMGCDEKEYSRSDLDHDGGVDLADFADFELLWTAP